MTVMVTAFVVVLPSLSSPALVVVAPLTVLELDDDDVVVLAAGVAGVIAGGLSCGCGTAMS